jgi:hypothetical protein
LLKLARVRAALRASALPPAAARLRSAERARACAELLRRTSAPVPLHHPELPGPPAWGPFTSPPFQVDVAAEALLGMLFANLFWVGLWDLVDNTLFPEDTNGQMMAMVGRMRAAHRHPLAAPPRAGCRARVRAAAAARTQLRVARCSASPPPPPAPGARAGRGGHARAVLYKLVV